MAEFNVTGKLDEKLLRLECSGSLVYEVSTQAREQVRPYFEKLSEGSHCLFLMDKLKRIDSTGFGVLIHFVRQAASRKIKLAVIVADPFILDLFRIAKFDQIMTVAVDEASALQALSTERSLPLSPQEY
jgi:anti-anti-sigma factor